MSKMAELDAEIRLMLKECMAPEEIASVLDIPLQWVLYISEDVE